MIERLINSSMARPRLHVSDDMQCFVLPWNSQLEYLARYATQESLHVFFGFYFCGLYEILLIDSLNHQLSPGSEPRSCSLWMQGPIVCPSSWKIRHITKIFPEQNSSLLIILPLDRTNTDGEIRIYIVINVYII